MQKKLDRQGLLQVNAKPRLRHLEAVEHGSPDLKLQPPQVPIMKTIIKQNMI